MGRLAPSGDLLHGETCSSGETCSMGRLAPWGDLLHWETCSMGRLAPWGDLLHGETCSMGRLAPWVDLLHGETCSFGRLAPWGDLRSLVAFASVRDAEGGSPVYFASVQDSEGGSPVTLHRFGGYGCLIGVRWKGGCRKGNPTHSHAFTRCRKKCARMREIGFLTHSRESE